MSYIIKRILQIPISFIVMFVLIFFVIRLTPGDPATTMLSPVATSSEIQSMRIKLGLDKPIYVQFVLFTKNILIGDIGDSLVQHQPVETLILEPLYYTFILVTATIIWVLFVSIPLGILSAIKRKSFLNKILSIVIYLGQAAPNFWLGIMLILFFAVKLRLLPSFGSDSFPHIILPSLALGIPLMARVVRLIRSEMIEVLDQDFIRLAKSKGLPQSKVIWKHALRNVLIPLVTDTGMQYGWLFANAVVIENVFAWPGIGSLTIDAISGRDYPLIQASVLTLTTIFILITFFVDIIYKYIDPRIRYQ